MTYYDHATAMAFGLKPWGHDEREGRGPTPVRMRRRGGLPELVGALLRAKWRVRGLPGR